VKRKTSLRFSANRSGIRALLAVVLCLWTASTRAQDPSPAVVAFFAAIKANDTNGVAQALASDTNLTRASYYGRLPLHVAASEGHGDIVAVLLKYGADVNAPGDTLATSNVRLTALDAAIWYNHPAICKQLLQAGADPNVQSPLHGSALHFAFDYHRDEMVGWLLDHGADPFLAGGNPYRPSVPFALANHRKRRQTGPRMLRESRLPPGPPKLELNSCWMASHRR